MSKSAYIKLTQTVSLDEVKEKLDHLIDHTSRTGEQLDWDYASAAFPYSVKEKKTSDGNHWLLLKGKESRLYKYLLIGMRSRQRRGNRIYSLDSGRGSRWGHSWRLRQSE